MKPLRAVLSMVVLGLLLAPAGALGAPANDNFAEREILPGPLPIEVDRSNVGAEKEEGEYIPFGLSPAGHSVWFEWEAEETGWVTIGACDPDFAALVGVFTGTELTNLTKAANGNAAEGPDCPYRQLQYTFKATSETKYVIVVDGERFRMPEAPEPDTEGEFTLRIEATPVPANDDFADAERLEGRIDVEPGGERFYFARVEGYNWGATTEAGEPAGSKASVWYRWTPPESGAYLVGSPCCGAALARTIYTGSSLGGLTPVATAQGQYLWATAGTTYYIAVVGEVNPDTGEPVMGGYNLLISAPLAPLPPDPTPGGGETPPAPQPDTTAPETKISKRVLKRTPPVFRFKFSSSEAGGTFRCSVDRRPFKPCGATRVFKKGAPGRHRLRVVAVDAAGNADPTPAVARFRFPPQHPQPRR
jgi:hypothetical protein